MQHHIVVADGYTLNPGDLSWKSLEKFGRVDVFPRSSREKFAERAKNATLLIVNKQPINAEVLASLPKLRCICASATGYNNIDVEACAKLGIPVCNVVGYGSTSVAQHVFAMLLTVCNRVQLHHNSVQQGDWARSADWCYWNQPLIELAGQTMGIYGLGKIGQQVARIAQGFEMKVLATHKHPERDAMEGVQFVDFETLCRQSDVISLNAPLNESNRGLINQRTLGWMKNTAILINTGRGGLIVEEDLREALLQGEIAAACLDVLSQEPPPHDHPLIGLKNCIVTPHQAWAARASRQRLLDAVIKNVAAFVEGNPTNVVNPNYKTQA